MRDAFIGRIYNEMGRRDDIFFLTADFGAPALDKIKCDYKDRFLNVGIAEQNLINVATGLALEGYNVYAYAIAPFLTMRAYEQIRSNLSITSQIKPVNVNLIGVGAGVSYVVSGPTHHCLEDISIMRLLPNFIVFSPSDWVSAEGFVEYSIDVKMPKYIRFDGKLLPQIYTDAKDIKIEDGFCELKSGNKLCLVTTGYMTHRALNVVQRINGIGLIDVFLLKPVNTESLSKALQRYEYIITIEEALINSGGLDSLISSILQSEYSNTRLKAMGFNNMGFNNRYVFELGDRDHLHRINGIDEDGIIKAIKKYL
jgi:transketolase